MKKIMLKLLSLVILINTTSCGYFLYPERRNQNYHSEELDAKIVILDAIGLLFFIIPGVIAFAVDFTTNTIYLPNSLEIGGNGSVVHLGQDTSNEAIQSAIQEATGLSINLADAKVERIY